MDTVLVAGEWRVEDGDGCVVSGGMISEAQAVKKARARASSAGETLYVYERDTQTHVIDSDGTIEWSIYGADERAEDL